MILRNCVIAGIAGVVIAFSIPKTYKSTAELVAETPEEGGTGGAAKLASLAGFNLGGSGEAIGPDLYPNVMSSNAFLVDLLDVEVSTVDNSFHGTYNEYLAEHTKSPWWARVTLWIKSIFKSSSPSSISKSNYKINPEYMTLEESMLIGGLKGTIQCDNGSDGLINITVRAQDPKVAKVMVDSATAKLQKFITDYRTNKARVDLAYYQELEKETLARYKEAQKKYALFCDSHKELSLKSYVVEQQSLENDLQLTFSTYSQMKEQVQLALAKVQERTPAFTVINASTVAPIAESPKKKLILAGILFCTLVATLGWIYFRLLFSKPTVKISSKKIETTGEQG